MKWKCENSNGCYVLYQNEITSLCFDRVPPRYHCRRQFARCMYNLPQHPSSHGDLFAPDNGESEARATVNSRGTKSSKGEDTVER